MAILGLRWVRRAQQHVEEESGQPAEVSRVLFHLSQPGFCRSQSPQLWMGVSVVKGCRCCVSHSRL